MTEIITPPTDIIVPDLVPIDGLPVAQFRQVGDSPLFLRAGPLGAARSPQWEKTRHAFAVLHPACAACGGVKLIQIHHCLPFHIHPELELDFANLITLCEDPERLCHHRMGHAWDWHAYNPHVRDDAAAQLERVLKRLYE
jgi:5-methylcytosine-specific restriction enzyme A